MIEEIFHKPQILIAGLLVLWAASRIMGELWSRWLNSGDDSTYREERPL